MIWNVLKWVGGKSLPAVKKGGEVIKTGSLIALVYFLYSIFDNRYVLKAEHTQVTVDMAVVKTKIVEIEKDVKTIDTNVGKILEVLHDRD